MPKINLIKFVSVRWYRRMTINQIKFSLRRKWYSSFYINWFYRRRLLIDNRFKMVGNTTRIVDAAVQVFFKTGKCRVIDHYGSREANKRTFNIFLRRLANEHSWDESRMNIYRTKFYVEIKPEVWNQMKSMK